jgi:hypothetical protein
MCLGWGGFAHCVAPKIIAAVYDEPNLSIFNWAFQDRGSLPLQHYLDRWNVIAVAALLAAVLHLAIVLFVYGTDRAQRVRFFDARQAVSHANVPIVVFSAAFLALTVLSGAQGDYKGSIDQWLAVLGGANPWDQDQVLPFGHNAYGPLFNVLAPLVWINPLANKLLFAFSYLAYVVWLIKVFAPRRGLFALSWPWLGLWLLNPFPWEQIAYFGYFDVLVSLACVAAVHNLLGNKDGVSGICLGLGILLKYMPIVILPFLVFSGRRFHIRLLGFCIGVVILGLLISVLIWGTSTFFPLTFAATRRPFWSIYVVLTSTHSPLRTFLDSSNVDWLEKSLLLTAGLGMFTWCMLRQIEPVLSSALAILVTLLFYRVGHANYQMVLFSLILYWTASNWAQFKHHSVLTTLLGGYFGFLTIANLAFWWVNGYFHSEAVVALLKFLLGCALFVGLVRLRPTRCVEFSSPAGESPGSPQGTGLA